MSDQTYAKAQAQQKTLGGSEPSRRLLQRTCACGGSPGIDGLCAECREKRLTSPSSRRGFEAPSVSAVAHDNSPAQENGPSFNSAFDRASRFGHDFSQIPIYPPATGVIQTKLAINKAGDSYEQEADRIADQVMTMPAHHAISGTPPHIQRFAGQPTGQTAPASVDQALASPSRPLEPTLRRDMEQRFGYDFSQVRVHSSMAAEQSARDVNAHAYTMGYDLVFGAGKFAPWTQVGRRLIAHELTHVVQQTGAEGISADPSDETRDLSPVSPKGQAPNHPQSSNYHGTIQLSPDPQSKQAQAGKSIVLDPQNKQAQAGKFSILLKYQGQPEKDRLIIPADDQEFLNNYVDINMVHAYVTLAPETNLDNIDLSRARELVIEYANGHKVSFNFNDIPLVKGPNPLQIKINVLPRWFEMRNGIIYPIDSLGNIAFSRFNTPNLLGLRLDGYERIEALRDLSTLRNLTYTFGRILSMNVGFLAGFHQLVSPLLTPRSTASPPEESTKKVLPPEGGTGKGKQASTSDIDTAVEKAFKTLPEADPHSGATQDPKSQIRSGVMTSYPASKDPKAGPSEVLDVGAGIQKPDLGLSPERQLVAVTSSDVSGAAQPDVILNAEKPIPKDMQGRFTTLIINNPYDYDPNIGELKQALRPGGKILVQGNWEANKYFRKLGTSPVPPNMTRTIERNLPPSAILGEGFRTSSGVKPVLPNARITFELTNPSGPTVH